MPTIRTDDGVDLHYVRRGDGDPVILLHGWPGFWYEWRRVVFPLAEGADVVVHLAFLIFGGGSFANELRPR